MAPLGIPRTSISKSSPFMNAPSKPSSMVRVAIIPAGGVPLVRTVPAVAFAATPSLISLTTVATQ